MSSPPPPPPCRSHDLSDTNGLRQLCGDEEEEGRGGGCRNLRTLKMDACMGIKASGLCWLLQVTVTCDVSRVTYDV
jgi:hypothetical protein